MRLMQWNIGGAYIRTPESDPRADASYCIPDIGHVAAIAAEVQPDIITLQETHQASDGVSQAEELADVLKLPYWVNDTHDESHIEPGQQFGQAVLSRHPIRNHQFKQLPNPDMLKQASGNQIIRSHNYGITTVTLETPGGELCVKTLHFPPLHFFGETPSTPVGRITLQNVSDAIEEPKLPTIIPGDFNLDVPDVLAPNLLPGLRNKHFTEVPNNSPTTPKGKRLDHVIYHALEVTRLIVNTHTLTDHYPLLIDFNFLPAHHEPPR